MRLCGILAAAGLGLALSGPLQGQQRDSVVTSDADSLDPQLQYELAMQARDARHYQAADSLLRRALLIDPHFAEANMALGSLPFERYPKLREMEEKDRVPDSLKATVEDAHHFLRLAALIDPLVGWGDAQYVFLPSWAMKNFSPRERARLPAWFFYWRGLSYARGGDYATALGDLREVLDRFGAASTQAPANAMLPLVANEIRYVMAVIELKAGRTLDARQQFEAVLAQDLGLYMAHVKLAELHERNGAWNAAIRERQRAVETNPGDPALLFGLATSLARAARLPEADSVVTRAIQLNPHNPEYVYLAGRVQLALGDTARATTSYRHFMAIAPNALAADRLTAQIQLARLDRQAAK
jgi:tetratricopeptide (TPR) repeat protein